MVPGNIAIRSIKTMNCDSIALQGEENIFQNQRESEKKYTIFHSFLCGWDVNTTQPLGITCSVLFGGGHKVAT
jgi:hypothetical protein